MQRSKTIRGLQPLIHHCTSGSPAPQRMSMRTLRSARAGRDRFATIFRNERQCSLKKLTCQVHVSRIASNRSRRIVFRRKTSRGLDISSCSRCDSHHGSWWVVGDLLRQAVLHRYCSGVVMDRPKNGFLKFFRVRFAGPVFGNPELSAQSSSSSPQLSSQNG
jgi:hypothetical protein